jgi:hypothetical protein
MRCEALEADNQADRLITDGRRIGRGDYRGQSEGWDSGMGPGPCAFLG